MENFFDLAKRRKTSYEFSDKKISREEILKILECARWAPSCTNSQPWNFIVVLNEARISQLMFTANYGDFHTDPVAIIAVVLRADFCNGENHSCFRGTDSNVHDSYMSCGIAASYMTLASEESGLSSFIVTPEQGKVKKILKIREEDAVPLLVGLGYPKKNSFEKKRERRDLKKSLHYEFFGGKKNEVNNR